MIKEELKSCPFCKGEAKIFLGKLQHCQLHGEPFQYVLIKCKSGYHTCQVTGGDVYNGGRELATEEAIKAWNTRGKENNNE